MAKPEGANLKLFENDLTTFLIQIAHELRGSALALTGFAHEQSEPADEAYAVLSTLAGGLENRAASLETMAHALCGTCRMLPVSEEVNVGSVAGRARTRPG